MNNSALDSADNKPRLRILVTIRASSHNPCDTLDRLLDEKMDSHEIGGAWLSIAETGRLFRTRALSPVELVRALLDRIEQLDDRYSAFLAVTGETALSEAKQAEAEIAAGNIRGPLHGIPYALKDLIDVAGLPTTCNSKIMQHNIASRDARVVTHLRAAGAILMGKASLHEFAAGGAMFDLPGPPARNPWNAALHPGGSSSGCGAALAAGFVPVAMGTDTGGSLRHPATACGVVGMKPTYGLVSCEGVFPLAPSLDHVGPLTRSVEDNALVLKMICEDQGSDYFSRLRAGVKGLRIGIIRHFYTEDAPANADHVRGIETAVDVLRGLGSWVEPVRVPELSEWTECGRVIQQFEQYRIHKKWLDTRPQDYSALAHIKFSAGASISHLELNAASEKRNMLREELARVSAEYDALITLSSLELPCRVDDREAVAQTYTRHARMPFNLTGTPALAVPTGFTREGLPLGMQIAGKAFAEPMLYRIGWAYCESTGWLDRHPS